MMNSDDKNSQQNNSRLPRGFAYSGRTKVPRTPSSDKKAPVDEAAEDLGAKLKGLDFRVYQAGADLGERIGSAGDGIERIGRAVVHAGDRVHRGAERLAMYIAAVEDCLTDG